MYGLYELKKSSINEEIVNKQEQWKVEKIRVTPKYFGIPASLYWNLITFGKARVFVVMSGNDIIHSSYVIPKCYKFPFLRGGKYKDIEIGPCQTRREDRGKGIYPYVLKEIVRRELRENEKAYMIVHGTNEASQRGVKKAGFVKIGQVQRDRMKRYVVCRK